MRFETALDAMKAGAKVKRPSWAGYWSWDEKKETIRMHCRPEESDTGEPVLDIRDTQRVEYTLRNTLTRGRNWCSVKLKKHRKTTYLAYRNLWLSNELRFTDNICLINVL